MTTIHHRLIATGRDLVASIVQALNREHRPWRIVHRLAALGRPGPGGPHAVRRPRPVQHEGATERFGSELRALRDLDVSPELVSDIETELRWGLIWHEFERTMQAEIDRVFAPYLPVPDCRDFDDVRELVGLRELASA